MQRITAGQIVSGAAVLVMIGVFAATMSRSEIAAGIAFGAFGLIAYAWGTSVTGSMASLSRRSARFASSPATAAARTAALAVCCVAATPMVESVA